jgi:hypothetical protein
MDTLVIRKLEVEWRKFVVLFAVGMGDQIQALENLANRFKNPEQFTRVNFGPMKDNQGNLPTQAGLAKFQLGDLQSQMDNVWDKAKAKPQISLQERMKAAKATEDSIKLADQEREKIENVIKALQFRNDQMSRSAEGQELYNQLRAAGTTLDTEAGQKIKELVQAGEAQTKMLEKQRQATERLQKAADGIGNAFSSAFEEAAFEADSFSDVINGLLNDIARSLFRSEIGEPISTEISGWIKDFFSDAPLRDSGGPVTGGQSYRVGVPELFIPSNTGHAIPLDKLPGNGYGQVIINNYGAPEKVQVKEAKRGGTTTLEVMIDQAVARNINSGGSATNRALRQFGTTPAHGR